MGVIAEGIPRGCQGLFTPVSLGYPLSVFNKNSTLKEFPKDVGGGGYPLRCRSFACECDCVRQIVCGCVVGGRKRGASIIFV